MSSRRATLLQVLRSKRSEAFLSFFWNARSLDAVQAELRSRGAFSSEQQPKLDSLLPLVALGTVADVV
jgi:single-stranded DNA-specific DHH superfamily exonuclease